MKTNSSNAITGIHSPRRYLAATLLCILSLFLCGGLLAYAGVPLALAESDAPAGEDRLAGIFITDHTIETEPPLLDVNAKGEIVIKEQASDKIYGTLNEVYCIAYPPVTFPEIDGFGLYNLQIWEKGSQQASGFCTQDDIFTDLHFTVTDTEDLTEASLYVRAGEPKAYYFYPVYQQADGEIYLLPSGGRGISSDFFYDGQKYSQSQSQSVSKKENGTEETEGYRYSVTMIAATPPETIELLFLDADNQVLQSLSGEELEFIYQYQGVGLTIPADVAYLILRQKKSGYSEYSHTLFDRGTESLEYLVATEDDFLHPRRLSLTWE